MVTNLNATGLEKIDQGGQRLAAILSGRTDGRDQVAEGMTGAVEFAVGVESFHLHTSFDQ